MLHAKPACFCPGRDPEAVATQLMKTIYDPTLSHEHRMVTAKYAPTIRVSRFKPLRICERNSCNAETAGNLPCGSTQAPRAASAPPAEVWDRLSKPWSVSSELVFFHHAINGDNAQPSQESAASEAQSFAGASTDEDVSPQAATLRLSLDLSDLMPYVAHKLQLLTDYDSDAFEIKNLSTKDILVAVRILPVPSDSGITIGVASISLVECFVPLVPLTRLRGQELPQERWQISSSGNHRTLSRT